MNKQPTVREINAHLFAGQGVCMVYRTDGIQFRISRIRTRQGQREGRVITGGGYYNQNGGTRWLDDWEAIPDDATVELKY